MYFAPAKFPSGEADIKWQWIESRNMSYLVLTNDYSILANTLRGLLWELIKLDLFIALHI